MNHTSCLTKMTACLITTLCLISESSIAAPSAQTQPTNCYNINNNQQCNLNYQEVCLQYNSVNSQTGCAQWGLIQCQWVENKEGTQLATWCLPLGKSYVMKQP